MDEINWLDVLGWGEPQIGDLRNVAYAYIKQGVYDVALTFLDTISAVGQLSFYDLQTMGALHLQMGNGLQALEMLNEALREKPGHYLTQLNRAKALFLLGHRTQALLQVLELENCPDKEIASQASALVLAYR